MHNDAFKIFICSYLTVELGSIFLPVLLPFTLSFYSLTLDLFLWVFWVSFASFWSIPWSGSEKISSCRGSLTMFTHYCFVPKRNEAVLLVRTDIPLQLVNKTASFCFGTERNRNVWIWSLSQFCQKVLIDTKVNFSCSTSSNILV